MTPTKGKATPGPWSYDGHGINSIAESHKGERIFKTCLDYSHGSVDRERAIADSNLVAASPMLLEAARAAEANLSPLYSSDHLVMRLLRDAIRAAEGE